MARWWLGHWLPSPPVRTLVWFSAASHTHRATLPEPVTPKDSAPSSGSHVHCTFMVYIQTRRQKYSGTEDESKSNEQTKLCYGTPCLRDDGEEAIVLFVS